jgi:hypothetical protein
MKLTPLLQKAQRAMRPGGLTRDGFLGADPRDLARILNDDHERVKQLGLTHARIARRLRELREAGLRGLGDFVAVPPRFEVRVESVRGRMPCPFGEAGLYPKTNITIRNAVLGRDLTVTDLLIHLIESHGFYEGRGSPFRCEPDDLAAVLELPPDASPE